MCRLASRQKTRNTQKREKLYIWQRPNETLMLIKMLRVSSKGMVDFGTSGAKHSALKATKIAWASFKRLALGKLKKAESSIFDAKSKKKCRVLNRAYAHGLKNLAWPIRLH